MCLAAGMLALGADAVGSLKVLYRFTGGSNGAGPRSIVAVGETLYGTTGAGANSDGGTVFLLNPRDRTERVLHVFTGAGDGSYPSSALVWLGGQLYGATLIGGTGHEGTLYTVNPRTRTEAVLYSFKGGTDGEGGGRRRPGRMGLIGSADGARPNSLVLLHGILYGTTLMGGGGCSAQGCGTIFSYDPGTGVETVRYHFTGGADASLPGGMVNLNDTLYGVTGGGAGTVFRFDPSGNTVTTLYAFKPGTTDVGGPGSPVLLNGMLYGTGHRGGVACYGGLPCGGIYEINPVTGAETMPYSFKGGAADGALPFSLIAYDGVLYGATVSGGSTLCRDHQGCGTLFQFNPATGGEAVLYAFRAKNGSNSLSAFPTLAVAGATVYGYTAGTRVRGADEFGSVFSFVP